MDGSPGVMLAIFFAATGDAASSALRMREALQAGLKRMQEVGGANLGDRTMVDALAPALEALGNGINEAAKAARTGADHTANTASQSRRSSYVSAEQL
jgi:dihydroxyacetone kinase